MASTQMQAVDALLGLAKTTWEANTPASTPFYYDNQDATRPSTPSLFGRAVLRHNFGERASLGSAGSGSKVNRRYGDLYIQIFVPQGDGQYTARTLADAMALAFEDADNSIGLRLQDTSINELGADGTYWQINVVTSFTYDRVS